MSKRGPGPSSNPAGAGPAPWAAGAAFFVPVLAAAAVYLPSLRNGFVWDDPTVLLQLRAFRSLGDFVVLPAIVPRFYYRPFIFATYLVDRALGGETPFWFHASVVAWHVLVTALVFVLGMRLFGGDRRLAGIAALLFAVFPTHVESVAWMAGRSDVVVGALVLLAVLFFDRDGPAAVALGTLAYFCALLSKEMAVACLVLVPLLDYLRRRAGTLARPRPWVRYLPLAVATLAYFLLRRNSIGAFVGGTEPAAGGGALWLDVVRAVGFYCVRAVFPFGLCAYIPSVPAHPVYLLAGIVAPTALAGLTFFAWSRRRWELVFLVGFFAASLAPSLTVILRRSASAVVAERYLYVPSVASCLLASWALLEAERRWRIPQGLVLAFVAVLGVVFAAQAVPYSRAWTSNLTFWSDVAAKLPGEALPQREVAAALQEAGRLDEAEQALQRAIAAPSSAEDRLMSLNNLSTLYRRMRRFDAAEQALDQALKIGEHPALYHNLGMTLMAKLEDAQRRGDTETIRRDLPRTRQAFERALAVGNADAAAHTFIDWDAAKTHSLLGQVLYSTGDRAGAREHLETALRLQPTGPIADLTRQYMQRLAP